MANPEHLIILERGVNAWNSWREEHPEIQPDLSSIYNCTKPLHLPSFSHANFSHTILNEAHLSSMNLAHTNFSEAHLNGANLSYANLISSNLSSANLKAADLSDAYLAFAKLTSARLEDARLIGTKCVGTDLSFAHLERAKANGISFLDCNLSFANLSFADLNDADFRMANLNGVNLDGVNLNYAKLVQTNLTGAFLTNCYVYGISAWDVQLKDAKQENLVITLSNKSNRITVDNLKIAQFIYLLLNNEEIRDIIDTVAKKAVLILGRFTPERKAVLDTLRNALRSHDYLPILFDFDKPSSQDLTETVSTLAHLSRFIIVDLTDPSSAPYEVGTIASNHIKPIQAIFHPSDEAKRVFAMFPDLIMRYHWVLPPYEYQDQKQLLASLQERVIAPAERKAEELARLRTQEFLK